MKDKGQALVEFIIVLPIFVLLILEGLDLGTILYKKYLLENDLDYIVELTKMNKEDEKNLYLTSNQLTLTVEKEEIYDTVIVSKMITINTPILKKVLKNPYKIEAKRVINNEP